MSKAALSICALTLSACGSSSSSVGQSPFVSGHSVTPSEASVQLSFVVPKKIAAKNMRAPQYVSTSTNSLAVTISPVGGPELSPTYVSCTASCSATLQAPVGNDSISLVLTDGIHGTGTTLSRVATTMQIVPGIVNTVNLTANPVLGSVLLSLGAVPTATVMPIAGAAVDIPVNITPLDPDGNTIIGPGHFVDVNGNPVALNVPVADTRQGGMGTVALQGSTTITTAGASNVTAHYDGGWLYQSSISVTADSSAVAAPASVTVRTVPHVIEYPMPGQPFGIIAATDGNLWITAYTGQAVVKMAPNGTILSTYSCGACSGPRYLAQGADGKLWFTEWLGNYIDNIDLNGAVTRVTSTPSKPLDIISGPGSTLAYSAWSGQAVGFVTTAGALSSYFPGADNVRGIGFGADGNLWYNDTSNSTIGTVTTTGVFLTQYPVAGMGSIGTGAPDSLILGPDNNLWFANNNADSVGNISVAGAVHQFPLQSGAGPRRLIFGPDGNLWITEQSTHSIARMTSTGTLTEYGAASGINLSATPIDIAVGPDGNIWFTESSSNSIGKFVL